MTMRIVVAGASGFLGGHLLRHLRHCGYDVATLVRRAPMSPSEFAWDPTAGVVPAAALRGADVVINLCGAGVADRRWTARRRELLRASRIGPTALLSDACVRHQVPTLINASAVGIYGDRGDEELTERSAPGTGFLARLCTDWEAATARAETAGVRVVLLRTGLVLGPDGGMLPRLALLTRMLLGGRLGSGRQWWPWISVVDHVAAVAFACREQISGPLNLTAPHPVTNAQFTAELARVLGRPAPWVIPPFALRAVLGGFAGEVLGGQRALPAALGAAGFRYLQPELGTALSALVR